MKKGRLKAFALVFKGNNKSGSITSEAEIIKSTLEKLAERSGTKNSITQTRVGIYRAIKNEGLQKDCLVKNVDCFISEYFLITDKSVFIISRTSPAEQPNFGQADFEKMLETVSIIPK